jgi:hypothetical protein
MIADVSTDPGADLACALTAMPFPHEHAARQLPPEGFVRFARKRLAPGVSAILGIDMRGKSHVQSLRFDKNQFTPVQARAWLARHGFRTEVEEARGGSTSPEWSG